MVGISADFYVLGYLTSQLKISLFIQYSILHVLKFALKLYEFTPIQIACLLMYRLPLTIM